MKTYFVLTAPSNIPDPGASLQGLLDAADIPALTLHTITNDGTLWHVVMKRTGGLGYSLSDAQIRARLSGYLGVPA